MDEIKINFENLEVVYIKEEDKDFAIFFEIRDNGYGYDLITFNHGLDEEPVIEDYSYSDYHCLYRD